MPPSDLESSWQHHQTFMREMEKTMKDSVDPGIQKIKAETDSVNSERLMGLICIKSELLLFFTGRCLCARGGSR